MSYNRTNPDTPGQPTFRPQIPIRITDLRRMWEMAYSSQDTALTGTICDTGGNTGGQSALDSTPTFFWARLISPPEYIGSDDLNESTLYSFVEVEDDGTGIGYMSFPGSMVGTYNAQSLNLEKHIPIPTPPVSFYGTIGEGSGGLDGTYYYVITSTWDNILTGEKNLQSSLSNEVSVYTGGTVDLAWNPPPPAKGYVLTGYQIWRGTTSAQENYLATTIADPTANSYTDNGFSYGSQSPLVGGNAGPIVLMSPYTSSYFSFRFVRIQDIWLEDILVTSNNPESIALPSGDTIQVWPAVFAEWDRISTDGTNPIYSNGLVVWFRGLNNEVPKENWVYPARLLGIDSNGVTIWASAVLVSTDTSDQTFNFYDDTFNFYTCDFNFYGDTFNFYDDTFNFFDDTFNFYGNNYWYIEDNSWIIIDYSPHHKGGGGVVFNVPFEICGYQFWCCTTWDLTGDYQLADADLPPVGDPDQGATVYDVQARELGTNLQGIMPTGMGPQLNDGDILNATNASPIVLTVKDWLTTPEVGKVVVVQGVLGNTAANGTFYVEDFDSTTLTLQDSAGNGDFRASPGSTVQYAGPQIIALHVVDGILILTDQDPASQQFAQIVFPPRYQDTNNPHQLQMGIYDSVILWWDYCVSQQWKILACTVGLTTKNHDNSDELTGDTNAIVADNFLSPLSTYSDAYPFGRIQFKINPADSQQNQLDWQGFFIYTAVSGYFGPEPDLEFSSPTCGEGGTSGSIIFDLSNNMGSQRNVVGMFTNGMSGTITSVSGGSFNSSSCMLTLSVQTITVNCGLIQSVTSD